MAAYDLPLQQIAGIRPTVSSNGGANLSSFLRQAETSRDNIRVDEDRDQRQAYVEGTPERERQAAIALNQQLNSFYKNTMTEAGDNYTIDPERLKRLQQAPGFRDSSVEFQTNYIADRYKAARADPAMFTDPSVLRASLRDRYSNSSLSPEEIDSRIESDMKREYNLMDKDIIKTLLSKQGSPNIKDFILGNGSGSNGNGRPNKANYNDRNSMAVSEFRTQKLADWEAEPGKGNLARKLGWDWGNPEILERDVIDWQTYAGQLGITENASLEALEVIRENDTFDVNLKDIMQADNSGDSKASKARINVMNRANSLMQQENRGFGANGFAGTSEGQATQQTLLQEYQRQAQAGQASQQQLLSGLRPRQASGIGKDQFWLGDFMPKENKAEATQPSAGGNAVDEVVNGTGEVVTGPKDKNLTPTENAEDTVAPNNGRTGNRAILGEGPVPSENSAPGESQLDISIDGVPSTDLSTSQLLESLNDVRFGTGMGGIQDRAGAAAKREEIYTLLDKRSGEELAPVTRERKDILLEAGISREIAESELKNMTTKMLRDAVNKLSSSSDTETTSIKNEFSDELNRRIKSNYSTGG